MIYSREIKILGYFNHNVEQLQGFNFWKNFPSDNGINITFDYSNKKIEVNSKIRGPDDETIIAFILKYRLFIQDKDDISLRNLEKLFLELPVEPNYKEKYKVLRQKINSILDEESNVQIKKHRVTIREIHDMFIYGAWAHLNENDLNRKRYLAIKDNRVIYPIFANDFNVTLIKIMNELVEIKFLNEEVIKILENQ
ncbi:hypothetical protein LJE86_14965 [bacterium BMS3Abin03]|nr:hypothetical protein [bacterium BMS3Abin03]